MKLDSTTKGFAFLLLCFAIYGSYYSAKLIWSPNDVKNIDDGFKMRGEIYIASDIIQIMIFTMEDSLGGTIALMNSIVQNTEKPVYFFIATDSNAMNHLWRWIEESKLKSVSYEIKGVTLDWIKNKVNLTGTLQQLFSYSKLFFHDIFPNLKGKFIILEDDIVVQGDINELSSVKLRNNEIGAFSSDCDTISKQFNFKGSKYGNAMYTFKEPLKSMKINANTCVFNLGVGVIDAQEWIRNNITNEAVSLIMQNEINKIFKFPGPFGAVLVTLYDRTTSLDPLWHIRNIGISSGSRYDSQFLSKAKLLHWNGPFKPWRKNSPHTYIWDSFYIPDPTGKFKIPRKFVE